MAYYRTRTYLAGDWDGDNNLIQTIINWNNSGYLSLYFSDAHELTQARDDSLYCSIKKSLSERLNASKTFVLIVGDKTNSVTQGSCRYCNLYSSNYATCSHNGYVDHRSYIKFECDRAAKYQAEGKMRIVVIYNYLYVHKEKCPESLRNIGTHIKGICRDKNGDIIWNYKEIKNAIMG